MIKKKIYFTSDWHIGHESILKFDKRPFSNLDEMHDKLVKTFNHYVPKHGVTYFLGDMSLKPQPLKEVILRLNGIKVLVRGNHDRKMYSLYECGFDVVIDKAQIMVGKHIVTMSHCPLLGVFREDVTGMRGAVDGEMWHGEKRHGHKYAFYDFGQFHLHGHIHSGPHNDKLRVNGRQMDVGITANNYKPVSLSEIESWISKYKKI